jgi:hypothetical protein
MPFRLKPDRPVHAEVKRVIDKQLALALDEMQTLGDPRSDDAIHEARRHVKKARALLRLTQASLGDVYRPANNRLRRANRLIAPIADGEAVVDTLVQIGRRYPNDVPRPVLTKLKEELLRREFSVDQQAAKHDVLTRAAVQVRAARKGIHRWRMTGSGFGVVAPGLRRTARRAHKAMARSLAAPTTEHFHTWRRRVKDLWLQVRLIEGLCGHGLTADKRRLDALDGCLGESHNCALLEDILATNTLMSRADTARCLRMIRRYQTSLRRTAARLGAVQFAETPRHFVERARHLWRTQRAVSARRPAKAS